MRCTFHRLKCSSPNRSKTGTDQPQYNNNNKSTTTNINTSLLKPTHSISNFWLSIARTFTWFYGLTETSSQGLRKSKKYYTHGGDSRQRTQSRRVEQTDIHPHRTTMQVTTASWDGVEKASIIEDVTTCVDNQKSWSLLLLTPPPPLPPCKKKRKNINS